MNMNFMYTKCFNDHFFLDAASRYYHMHYACMPFLDDGSRRLICTMNYDPALYASHFLVSYTAPERS